MTSGPTGYPQTLAPTCCCAANSSLFKCQGLFCQVAVQGEALARLTAVQLRTHLPDHGGDTGYKHTSGWNALLRGHGVVARHLQTVVELCRLPSPAPPSRHRGLLLLLVMAAPVHRVTSTSFQPFCLNPWLSNILYREDISSLCEEIKADIPYIG